MVDGIAPPSLLVLTQHGEALTIGNILLALNFLGVGVFETTLYSRFGKFLTGVCKDDLALEIFCLTLVTLFRSSNISQRFCFKTSILVRISSSNRTNLLSLFTQNLQAYPYRATLKFS